MKRLFAYLMVVAFLAMNVATAAHADCMGAGCAAIEASATTHDDDSHNDEQSAASCDCCMSCGHHHHTQAFLPHTGTEHLAVDHSATNGWDSTDQLSALQYPPSRPPKA